MADLIDRQAAKEAVKYIPWCDWKAVGDCLDELPTSDAVSRGLFEQIKWERDIAMEQLEEHGIAFGAKAEFAVDAVEVVRCRDCKWYERVMYSKRFRCCKIGGLEAPDADDFCSYGEQRGKDG